jgi:uncharacterized membrane protein (UPF0127 family)
MRLYFRVDGTMSDCLCVTNESKRVVITPRAKVASSLWTRFRGLLGEVSLPDGEALWLAPCRSVHTFFMRFPIDVLFIDSQGVVLSKATLVPWRVSRWVPRAAGVLELAAGTLERTRTDVGDRVSLRPI